MGPPKSTGLSHFSERLPFWGLDTVLGPHLDLQGSVTCGKTNGCEKLVRSKLRPEHLEAMNRPSQRGSLVLCFSCSHHSGNQRGDWACFTQVSDVDRGWGRENREREQ